MSGAVWKLELGFYYVGRLVRNVDGRLRSWSTFSIMVRQNHAFPQSDIRFTHVWTWRWVCAMHASGCGASMHGMWGNSFVDATWNRSARVPRSFARTGMRRDKRIVLSSSSRTWHHAFSMSQQINSSAFTIQRNWNAVTLCSLSFYCHGELESILASMNQTYLVVQTISQLCRDLPGDMYVLNKSSKSQLL